MPAAGVSARLRVVAGRLEFVLGDLAREEVDAIVNPVNSGFLLSFAGVNGALLEAAGEVLADECRGLGLAGEGEVRATRPGRLHCRYVLHAVSPIWHDGARGERERLARLHRNVATAAVQLDCRSIALPAVGCGAHGFPTEVAAEAAVRTVEEALAEHSTLEFVRFVFLSASLRDEYHAVSDRAVHR
jgi:O-acetyl-ADP-ribose deacetylase